MFIADSVGVMENCILVNNYAVSVITVYIYIYNVTMCVCMSVCVYECKILSIPCWASFRFFFLFDYLLSM
jgi:hypothetical protein